MAISAKLVKELRDKSGAGMMDCKKALEATDGNIDAAFDWLRENGKAKSEKKAGRIAAEGLSAFVINGSKAAIVEVNSETDFVARNEDFKKMVNAIATTVCENNPADLDAALQLEVNGQTLAEYVTDQTATIGEKLSFRRFVVLEKNDSQNFGAYSHMGGAISALVLGTNLSEEKARDIAMHVAATAPKYISEKEIPEEERNHELEVLKTQALAENAAAAKPKPENIIEKMVQGRLKKSFQEICLLDQPFVKNPDQTVAQFIGDATIDTIVRFQVGEGIEKREDNFAEEVAAQMAGK